MAAAGKMVIQTSYQGLDYHGRDIGAGGYQADLGRRISLIHQIDGNQAGKKGQRAKITCIHAEITDIMIPRKRQVFVRQLTATMVRTAVAVLVFFL